MGEITLQLHTQQIQVLKDTLAPVPTHRNSPKTRLPPPGGNPVTREVPPARVRPQTRVRPLHKVAPKTRLPPPGGNPVTREVPPARVRPQTRDRKKLLHRGAPKR